MNKHIIGIAIGSVLTALSYLSGYFWFGLESVNPIEAFAVFTSYWCTYLCVVQSRDNYPIGVVSVAALCVVFYQQALLSSMVLQIYLFFVLIYGWFRWGPDRSSRAVTPVRADWWLIGYAAITGITYAATVLVASYFGAAVAGWDAAILVLSILAQFLLDNKKLHTWHVWVIVDIIAVCVYLDQGLYIVAVQMGLFGLNAVWGWYEWRKTEATTCAA